MLGETLDHVGFAAIIGVPNSGKSTFINRVVESKISIVTPKAQTTRNKIRGIYTDNDSQIIFTDTPGITSGDFGKLLNSWMNKYSFSAAKDADLTLFFVDVSKQHPELGIGEEEAHILKNLDPKIPTILVVNKIDAVKPMRVDDTIAVYRKRFDFAASYAISAQNGEGIQALIEGIKHYLNPGPQYFPEDTATDQDDEFLISEIIREKLFNELTQELPYSIVVTVERVRYNQPKNLFSIEATIHVARDSQKGIVVGHKGETLKKIGTLARKELEEIYDCKVGLNLFVRVEEKWFDKERLLKKVGFEKDFENLK